MDAKKICTTLVVLTLSSPLCFAGHSGKIRFIGAVVEAGCWNIVGSQNITCQRNHVTTHYSLKDSNNMVLQENNATVSTSWVNENKHLVQLNIRYD
ncbi:hypothetical protein M8A54_004237 [Salmonella enterica]|nr:hypothetical protein [Salmonella enterica]